MRVVAPKPFTFEGGSRAVLLLHGFSGTTADVRMLGRFLQKNGYTCHAPLYDGHGVPPEELLKTGPGDWWQNVSEGYKVLKEKGYKEIAVAGLSLGGVFSLKIGYTLPIKGLITMCAPFRAKSEESLYDSVLAYARKYKELEGKTNEQINEEMNAFKQIDTRISSELVKLFTEVEAQLHNITSPLFVIQSRHDEVIDAKSAYEIHELAGSSAKQIKWYEESTHVITIGKEKDQLHEDVYQFLETLDWTV